MNTIKKLKKTCRNISNLIKFNFVKKFIYGRDTDFLVHTHSLLLAKFNSLNETILLLSSYDRGEEANILVRSLLETTLYLLLLVKFPSNELAKYIYFSANNTVYRNMLKPKIKERLKHNPYYTSVIEQQKPMIESFNQAKERYKIIREDLFPGLKFNDIKYPNMGLSNRQIAKLVGLEDIYDYIYWQLCNASHPNLSGLSSRVKIVENGYDINLGKTKREVPAALFYTLDIDLSFLKQFYTKDKITTKYQKERDLIEAELVLSQYS
jgi:hypothetical protein